MIILRKGELLLNMKGVDRPRKINIKDVALKAEVSTATVSRVLNNHPKINEITMKTRQKVWEAAQSLGYIPNFAGKQLRLGYDFSSVGILFSKGMEKLSNEPFFWSVVEGIHSEVGDSYQCIHLDKRYLTKFGGGQILNELVKSIITVDYIDDDLMMILKEYRRPIVCVFPGRDVSPFVSIEADDREGIFNVIRYLSTIGHERLVFVSGCLGNFERPVFKNRYQYCLEAAKQFNIVEIQKLYVQNWHATTRDGRLHKKEEKFLIKNLGNISAIIAANDYIALWLIKVLTSNGVSIPEDISIVGYDNVYLASLSNPTLSTVEIPAVYAGQLAAKVCQKLLKHEDSIPYKQLIKTKLIIRESSKKIKRD